MFASFLNSLQDTSLFSFIRGSSWTYLVILSLHMAALAVFGGMVLATDLRLIGIGMRSYSVSEVVNGLRIPKRFGFVLAVVSGVLLFGSQAGQYSYNPWFWAKITLLILIGVNYLVFRRGVYNAYPGEKESSKQTSARAKLAAGISLLLWTGVICAGRGPATIKDVMHSMVDPNGDFIFESIQNIGDEHGVHQKAPRTDAEWEDIRRHLAVLRQAPDLVDGRRAARPRDRSRNPQSENEPEEVQKAVAADPASLDRRARRLQNAATLAMKAVDARDKEALLRAIDGIDKACENCHLHYWYPNDHRAQEAAKEDGVTDTDPAAAANTEPDNPTGSR
jgi:Cytochrome C'